MATNGAMIATDARVDVQPQRRAPARVGPDRRSGSIVPYGKTRRRADQHRSCRRRSRAPSRRRRRDSWPPRGMRRNSMSISRAALVNAGCAEYGSTMLPRLSALPDWRATVVAARHDRGDDALRAAGREEAGRVVGRVEQRQAHRDDLVFHLFQAVERALAAQRVLGEELHERVAAERRDLVVGLEDVQRYAAATPVDVAGGKRLHAREDLVAGYSDDGELGAHGSVWVSRRMGQDAAGRPGRQGSLCVLNLENGATGYCCATAPPETSPRSARTHHRCQDRYGPRRARPAMSSARPTRRRARASVRVE